MNEKIEQYQKYVNQYNEGIKKGFELLEKLEEFEGKTINKTFFEKTSLVGFTFVREWIILDIQT